MKSETQNQYDTSLAAEPKRHFTGYWIPVELERLGLTRTEQFLLAIIDSLDSGSPGHCYASNSYLAEKCDLSESRVSFYITKLKRMELIAEAGWDGRRRRLKSLKHNWYNPDFSKKVLCVKARSLHTRSHVGRVRESAIHITKDIKKDKSVLSCVEAAPVAPLPTIKIQKTTKKDFKGKDIEVSKEDLYSECVLKNKDWTKPEIEEAWKVLEKYETPVRDWFKFCEGTIQNFRKLAKIRELKGETICKTKQPKITKTEISVSSPQQKEPSKTTSVPTSENVSSVHPLESWKLNLKPWKPFSST